ncbi:Gfo/Idh/MocA family oxidoreductase [Kitasatospora sp. NA04385]|uniref:Gfo/Idh/MocA family protein n=1 Tax=Kitasatospora sp. NA04385 TaxID=2742135 RepID=UPI0015925BF8|nr:Gfo/Idh/MocA family oxidoreductase [Kitasatospora sp. NA04385]QKW21688.1 Gfo/Idh/MocA family oxidoreductase [Kitasatospora sp. NA04385]
MAEPLRIGVPGCADLRAARPPLRIGVLGCAEIARRRMLPAIAARPGLRLAAVASRDAERAAPLAAQYGARAVAGYRALVEDPGVDAVYVPLPIALHAEWAAAALAAGKHVLAEKPLTADPAATAALQRQAERAGLVLRENVMFVHHPAHERVRGLLADGAIGELRAFSAAFAIPGLPPTDIRHRPELGGGALLDVGYYPVRAALHFLGPRLTVAGAVLHRGAGSAVDTSGAALLRTPDGVSAQLAFGMEHAYRSSYELWGSTGRIRVERAFTPPADQAPTVLLERGGESERIALEPADQVDAALAAFAAAVAARDTAADPLIRRQAELLREVREAAAH